MQGITQSLAGRAAVLSLLPFSFAERIGWGDKFQEISPLVKAPTRSLKTGAKPKISLAEIILRGNYPEIASKKIVDRQLWCGSYISTYLKREVRNLAQVGDLGQFERFLRL